MKVGGIFGDWQTQVNEVESALKAETTLRGEKGARFGRILKRKVSCEGRGLLIVRRGVSVFQWMPVKYSL